MSLFDGFWNTRDVELERQAALLVSAVDRSTVQQKAIAAELKTMNELLREIAFPQVARIDIQTEGIEMLTTDGKEKLNITCKSQPGTVLPVPTSLTLTSSDATIVDAQFVGGVPYAIAGGTPGTATITATLQTSKGPVSGSIDITVTLPEVATIEISETEEEPK